MTPAQIIARIADAADIFASQAGVGGMETAGSMVSYLAKHPEQIDAFLATGSVMDWPVKWHAEGCLTWHAASGKVVSPDFVRRHDAIRRLEKGK